MPPSVFTRTSSVPVPAGLVATSSLADTNSTSVAALEPNLTSLFFVKPLPLIVTDVPPPVGPSFGEIPLTAGVTSAS